MLFRSRDNEVIPGANSPIYVHNSGNIEASYNYYYILTTKEGDSIKSENFDVMDVLCCIDSVGNAMSSKLIWQDDFGTFTSAGNYWVWDYSDIKEPKKIQKTTELKNSNGWSYCDLDYSIPGAECMSMLSGEGTFSITGNVTSIWGDLSGGDGTQWEWQAQSFNAKNPNENGFVFVPDHTYQGSAYGAIDRKSVV